VAKMEDLYGAADEVWRAGPGSEDDMPKVEGGVTDPIGAAAATEGVLFNSKGSIATFNDREERVSGHLSGSAEEKHLSLLQRDDSAGSSAGGGPVAAILPAPPRPARNSPGRGVGASSRA
jgi:hypothetical protein